MPYEAFPELYMEDVKNRFPLSMFCEIFKINADEFDSDDYESFIKNLTEEEENFPDNIDFDTFADICECSEIDEEEYDAAIKKVSELGVVDYETFCESIDEDRYSVKCIYNPVTKTYQR